MVDSSRPHTLAAYTLAATHTAVVSEYEQTIDSCLAVMTSRTATPKHLEDLWLRAGSLIH